MSLRIPKFTLRLDKVREMQLREAEEEGPLPSDNKAQRGDKSPRDSGIKAARGTKQLEPSGYDPYGRPAGNRT